MSRQALVRLGQARPSRKHAVAVAYEPGSRSRRLSERSV